MMISFRAQLPSFYFILCVASLVIVHTSDSDGAGIVYDLVDHGVPDHTLSGTITVADTAADDGLLDVSEVLSWQVEVSGSVVNFSIDDTADGANVNFIGTVNISPARIFSTEEGYDPNGDWLRFSIGDSYAFYKNEARVGWAAHYQLIYHRELGLFGDPWTSPKLSWAGPFVHATVAVPEPSTFCLCLGLAGAGLAGWRNRTANRDPS